MLSRLWAHLIMQLNKIITFCDVVLYGLQFCLSELCLILLAILFGITALIQDCFQHVMIGKVLQLVLNTCQADLGSGNIQIS